MATKRGNFKQVYKDGKRRNGQGKIGVQYNMLALPEIPKQSQSCFLVFNQGDPKGDS